MKALFFLLFGTVSLTTFAQDIYLVDQLTCHALGTNLFVEVRLNQPKRDRGFLNYYTVPPSSDMPRFKITSISSKVTGGKNVSLLSTEEGTFSLTRPANVTGVGLPKKSVLVDPNGFPLSCQFQMRREKKR